ncbi:MAG TPA: hypothetical protein VGQ76_03485 [Thermoanaerobaculia bacterium]|jgi:hypothetical protein|nr:hypothetical protein [Thermoanaerobaculia bacterium]
MSSKVHFSVVNSLPVAVQENVLVFLMPMDANANYQFAAWQNLKISPNGGSEPFDYVIDIAVQAVDMTNGSASAKTPIKPGQVLDVVFSNVGGIALQNDPDTGRVTPEQCGVINKLSPNPHLIETHWFVNGNPCVAIQNLNQESIQTFQLEASLYFLAAIPTLHGFNFSLQQVSQQTQYVIPASADTVIATWSRPGGIQNADHFEFVPPSGAIPELVQPPLKAAAGGRR